MNLQERTILVLLITLIAVLSIISIFVSAIYLSSYTSLEQDYVAKDLRGAVSTLDNEQATLAAIVADWGPWDDTYDFVNGKNPDYVKKNLVPETFSNLNMNIIVITGPDGKIAYAGAYDLQKRETVPVPESLIKTLVPPSPLIMTADPRGAVTGIITLPEGPLIVASRPVVRTDYSGVPDGVVLMGRYLNAAEINRLGVLTDPSLNITGIGNAGLSTSVLSGLRSQDTITPELVRTIDKKTIAGYALIRDLYGNDALVLSIVEPRNIYTQGIDTTLQFLAIILAAGLFLGVVILIFIDRFVLSRISALSLQVHEIGRDSSVSKRIGMQGDDELSGLGNEINGMLEKIEKTQRDLQQSEVRFRELTDLLPLIIFEMDLEGNITYANKFGLEIFRMDPSDLKKKVKAQQFIVPSDVERMFRNLQKIANGVHATGEVYSLVTADKTSLRALVYTNAIVRDGVVRGFRGCVIDITDRLLLEDALAENEEYLKTLLATVQVGIVVVDAETFRIIDANPAALAMIGATKETLQANVCHKYICPEEAGSCPVMDLGQKVDNSERILATCDGRKIPIIKYVVPVTLHGKKCLLETFIDNSYRQQIEHQLKESEEKYRSLTESTPDVLFSTDPDGFLTYVSPQVNQYGFLADELVGKLLFSFIHPEDRARVIEAFRNELADRAQFTATFRVLDKWEHLIWFEVKSFLRLDEYGQPSGVYGMLRDVTERKRAEDAIELANKKLNLMNNITRHDILNTITGLLGCVDMVNATTSAPERTQLLGEIKDLTRVIQRQINFTKEYQEVGVHLPLWQNVNDVIRRVEVNFEKSGIAFAIDLENTEVYADPLLEKVFYNLVDNAIRYGERTTTMKFYFLISDKGLSLICEDDGVGIPDNLKQIIFERGVGRNTGMGLFLSREILGITGIGIEENGIFGNGARFEMLIPPGDIQVRPSEYIPGPESDTLIYPAL